MNNYILHKAADRGHANHGWLNSYHSFSFASYHDSNKMGFGLLRVLNDDTVAAGKGFGAHPHHNMEIISIPTKGALAHRDSTGRNKIINALDVQIMSAGSGITHAEMNASNEEAVKFFQIWIFPKTENTTPTYAQQTFTMEQRHNKLLPVVTPGGVDGGLDINQDAWIFLSHADAGIHLDHKTKTDGNGLYLFVIDGQVTVNSIVLNKSDAIGLPNGFAQIVAQTNAQILLLDVPMK
jgi:redox-sensitive bicupin YhaK (pirin superfamily)